MYGQFFNIDESAFSIAPNPKYLFLSKQHEEALAHLLYGVRRKGGFVCLTGDIGTGKTTVCRCVFEQLPENTDIAFVINPMCSPIELFASICDELGINYSKAQLSIKNYENKLHEYLIDTHAKGKSIVLVIDEAQNLSIDALEHIRSLTNLETNEQKLLQIILIGQPELRTLLAKPELEQVNQRITARFHIGPLSLKETIQYIHHRLAIAGAKHKVFTQSNIKEIYAQSKGVPRLINILCDRVLLGAYTLGTAEITSKIIRQSAEEVFDRSLINFSIVPKALAASVAVFFISAFILMGLQNTKMEVVPKDKVVLSDLNENKNNLAQSSNFITNDVANIKEENQSYKPEGKEIKLEEISEKAASFIMPLSKEVDDIKSDVESLSKDLGQLSTQDEGHSELHLTGYGKAYKQLFRLWGVNYTSQDVDPCEHALKNQLHCYRASGNVKQIINLNRPVLLRSKDDHFEPSFIVMVSVEEDYAVISQGEEYQLAAISEIESNWDGYYEMLWRPLQAGVSYIEPGYKGKVVALLDEKLASLQGRKPLQENPFEYSEDLVAHVRAFQLANKLPIDGVVGPITQMYFNNNNSNTPYLTK